LYLVTPPSLLEAKVATFRKRDNKWQAIVRHKSIGTKAKSFHSKAQAKLWAIETEKSIEANTFNKLCSTSVTLGDLLSRYRKEITPKKRSKDNESRRIQRLLNDPISLTSMDNLTSACLAQFRDRRLLDGKRTTQYDLVIIRHCIKMAMFEWDLLLDRNPVDLVKLPSAPKPRERRLEKGELEQIIKAAEQTQNPHILPIILFAIETGMRRSEILGLEWKHIHLEKRIAHLPLTKNGSSRDVPLTGKAQSILERQRQLNTPSPFPVTPNALRMAWDRLIRRTHITNLRFHDLRHEAISRFFEMGLSMPEVALISGHKDPRMLFRYTHLDPERLLAKFV
jgi:integrase